MGITPGTYSAIDSWPYFLVGLSRSLRYTRDWMGLQNGTRLLIVRITPGTYSTIDSWPYFPGRLEKVCIRYTCDWLGLQNGTRL